jgi:adenine-specific DNA methylase
MIKKIYIGRHVKYPLFLSYFNESWISTKDFRKILKHQILWESVQQEPSRSMRTDRHEASSSILQFCESA